MPSRHRLFPVSLLAVVTLSLTLASCSDKSADDTSGATDSASAVATSSAPNTSGAERADSSEKVEGRDEQHGEGKGEHDSARSGSGEGEEGGVYVQRDGTWNETRRGLRLILTFDETSSAFVGRAENTTQATICGVRVEVHLVRPKKELTPIRQQKLPPGTSALLNLPAGGAAFEKWSAHAESSGCE